MRDKEVIDLKAVRDSLQTFNFSALFIEQLGWNHPNHRENSVSIQKDKIPYSYIAQIKSIPILYLQYEFWDKFKHKSDRRKLHKEIKKQHEKNLLIVSDKKTFFSLSYLNKDNSVKIHDYFKGQNGDTFIGKLAGIHIGIESQEPSITEISTRLDDAFNTDKVTKRFFNDFKSGHLDFQKYIKGIEKDQDKAWYSSVVLNRLMFIWFLQKKGFLDDEDYDYLQNKFKTYGGKKKSYYSSFLKLLFFEGFAKRPQERSPEAKRVLGNIKYLNGGLFVPHPIEDKYERKLDIDDKAFETIFNIFSQYDWHNEDTKGGSNEISPDVLGHIFEKRINESQRKSSGAYYTRDEITSYLAEKNIRKYIIEKINEKGYKFQSIDQCLHNLNARLCKILLTDENSILNTLTVLDPAVGSGAFLIAAMKVLINTYSPIIGKIETLSNRELNNWLEDFKKAHTSVIYGIKKQIILKNLYGVDIMKEAVEVCKLRLFLSLASSALEKKELEPLPNIDFNIMEGNSLVGFLKEENLEEQTDIFGRSYTQTLEKYKELVGKYRREQLTFEKLKTLKEKISNFLKQSNEVINDIIADRCNDTKLRYELVDTNKKVKNRRAVTKNDIGDMEPFQWDFAFNDIIKSKGFDIILTNPPWDKVQIEDKEFFQKYDKSIQKNKTSNRELKEKKERLLKKYSYKGRLYKTEQ